MSLQSRIADLITSIGADIKDLKTRVTTLESSGGGGGMTQSQILQRTLGS